MAVGKNKGLAKKSTKGQRKKIVDPFTRKEWYDVKAPSMFINRTIGKTLVNRTQGTKTASGNLKGRVFIASVSDLQCDPDPERCFMNFHLIAEHVQGLNVLTNFHGLSLTSDKLKSMVKTGQSLIETYADVKTSDGYLLRIFVVGFTTQHPFSKKKTAYAQKSQIKRIRRKMCEVVKAEIGNSDLREVVCKLIPDVIGKEAERACSHIFPLYNVNVTKVKVLRKPRFVLSKLLSLYGDETHYGAGDAGEDIGEPVEVPDTYEPPVVDSV